MVSFTPDQSRFLSDVLNKSKTYEVICNASLMDALSLKKEILAVEMYGKPYNLLSAEAVNLLVDAGQELGVDARALFPELP